MPIRVTSPIGKFILLQFCFALSLTALLASPADTASHASTKLEKPGLTKADNLFVNQQYREALNAYSEVYTANSGNPDLNFKMGLCYHYLLQFPDLCKQYFTTAARKNTNKYNFYNNQNSATSFDANYFLGKTYLLLNKTDSAMYYLADWGSELKNDAPMDAARQLKMCVNYNILRKQPRDVSVNRLPLPVNTLHSETNPVLSINHQTLYFASNKPEGETVNQLLADDDIYYCTLRKDGQWSDPISFTGNTPFDEQPLYLSTDGKKLYFRRTTKKGSGDIYVASLEQDKWGVPQKVKQASTPFDEKGIALSADGTQMVVASNSPDGLGGYDLYFAKSKNGKFGKLTNMGAKVNTELDELFPYFHPVDKRIYFSTNGNIKLGMGGYDVFFTQSDSASNWSEAFTMGYPLNKGGNELSYYVVSEGVSLYTAVSDNGDFDIYEIKRGNATEDIEQEIFADNKVTQSVDNSIVEVLEVEREKIVEKDREVEVLKLEEVTIEVQKNVGMVDAEQAKNLDNVIAIEQKEVQVQVPVEVEVVTASGTRPLMSADGTIRNTDGTIQQELTNQNKGITSPASETLSTPEVTVSNSSSSYNNSSYNTTSTANVAEADNTNSTYNSSQPTNVIDKENTETTSSYSTKKVEAELTIEEENTAVKKETTSPKLVKEATPYTKSYTHIVNQGETLESIAKKYDVSVYDLKKWNKLKLNNISAESMLVVGYAYDENLKYDLAMKQLDMAGVSKEDKDGIIESVKKMLQEKLSRQHTAVYKSIPFNFNSKTIGISNAEIDLLTVYMKEHKDVTIEVVGHTDNIGAWETNFWISRERAKNIYDNLVARGISTSRIIFNGKGAIQPIASNTSQEGRAKNRRVEVILLQ